MDADALTKLIRAAAAEAANYQERFAAADTEARKIVDIMETFLRVKGRVVYGGAAINAHMPADQKFYDPAVNLPDYDFLTPDPLQDCADLIVTFQEEGFTDVEAKFGIHEGTYKVFVNYRAAADITFMPEDLYGRLATDAVLIDGIRYASPDYLRMNMYLELSRPAGDVSRWEKVYKRLLLLNEVHPPRAGHCVSNPLAALGSGDSDSVTSDVTTLYDKIVEAGIAAEAVFLSGASYLASPKPVTPDAESVVLLVSAAPAALHTALTTGGRLKPTTYPAVGELLPARTEYHTRKGRLTAVVFETVACHAYTTLGSPAPEGYRLASLDFLIHMYLAFHFTGLQDYIGVRIQCVIQSLIDIESERRLRAAAKGGDAHDVFPLDCIGHQPSLPELKKAHRLRVREKRVELAGVLQMDSGLRPGGRSSSATTQRRKKATGKKSRKTRRQTLDI
jgi:hypothetical protein